MNFDIIQQELDTLGVPLPEQASVMADLMMVTFSEIFKEKGIAIDDDMPFDKIREMTDQMISSGTINQSEFEQSFKLVFDNYKNYLLHN